MKCWSAQRGDHVLYRPSRQKPARSAGCWMMAPLPPRSHSLSGLGFGKKGRFQTWERRGAWYPSSANNVNREPGQRGEAQRGEEQGWKENVGDLESGCGFAGTLFKAFPSSAEPTTPETCRGGGRQMRKQISRGSDLAEVNRL